MSSSPDMDPDAIRLARIQALQQRQRAQNSPSQEAPSSQLPAPDTTKAEAPISQPRPESRLLAASEAAQKSSILKRPISSEPTGPKGSPPLPVNPHLAENGLSSEEAWEDQRLSHIFRAALRASPRATAGGYRVLESLCKDLEEEAGQDGKGKVPRLSLAVLDQLILSVSSETDVIPLNYLLGCWKRAMDIQRKTPANRIDDQKLLILKEARRMCVNYALYCIIMPDMFDGKQPYVRLDHLLLIDSEDEGGLPQGVLLEFVTKFEEEPELVERFKDTFRLWSSHLGMLSMNDNYKPYINALGRIAHIKPLAEIFVNMPEFLRDVLPHDIERAMLLGPFFRISPLQPEASSQYFSNAKPKTDVNIRDATSALRMATRALQEQLAQIVTAFCKISDHVRSRVLSFFAKVINANKKRAAINVDHSSVASDAFMINISAVLNRLCEPFMDASFSKINRIDVNYFRRNPKLDISDETKLNADVKSSEEFYAETVEGKDNFITEVFFLNMAANHYGLGTTEIQYEGLCKDIPEMERHLERIKEDREKYIGTPALAVMDRNIQKISDRIDVATAYKYGLEAVLMDNTLQASVLLFMRYQMAWLLRLIDPDHQYPSKLFSLPLPEPPCKRFSHLPEYVVESVGNIISFVSIYTPEVLLSTQLADLLIFAVTALRSSSYIQKANLKSKLIEIIFWGTRPTRGGGNGYLLELVHGSRFVLQNLMHALMNFYIEIEKHYYEKFTVRYHISKIIQQIWSNQTYRSSLEKESDQNVDFFVRFVALLLNDVTYVLDNSLTALADIHRLQNELESSSAEFFSDEQKADKEKALHKAEKDATSYMQLGNETVIMLNLFTSTIADAFVQPEIVSRLAGMLDYNLEALVGSKCNSLRVRNPEKYRFNPKVLLGEITGVYVNLCKKRPFVEAIARDGRSYKPKTFELALGVLTKHHLKSNEDILALARLADMVKEIKQREDEEELELGDIPDEFTDPLMATLMEDPVILPTSKTRIDRQTIKAHLLSDATDPFNRSPLKIEDVVPDVELKLRIDAWVEERRKAIRAEKAPLMEVGEKNGEKMDIDS